MCVVRCWLNKTVVLPIALTFVALGGAFASSPMRTKIFGGKGPVNVQSETMSVFNKKGLAIWRGSVVATQAEATLKCDELEAAYDEKGAGNVTMLIARGNVHLTQPGRVVKSARATFDNRTRTLTFTGAPRVFEGENTLEGERIVVFVDDDRVEVAKARGKMKIKEPERPARASARRKAR